jgi:L-alanine-DL-glutamate epimerase-like enolase superfamily enzyme
MDEVLPHNLMAKCAIDIAAHDLVAKSKNSPLYSMLGGKKRDRIPLAFTIGLVSPEEAAERAVEYVSRGATTIKIKIGVHTAKDFSRVEAVRKAVGGDLSLRVDCNQGYSFEQALEVLPRLEALGLEWIEQPLASWDLEGMARLCSELETPVAADESVYTIYDAKRVVSMRSADVINVKLPKCGGLYRARGIASYCLGKGVPCFLGGCIETTPGTAAQAHFYVSTENVISAAEMEGPWRYKDDIVRERLGLEKGSIILPHGPGLGVEIDEERLEKYSAQFHEVY